MSLTRAGCLAPAALGGLNGEFVPKIDVIEGLTAGAARAVVGAVDADAEEPVAVASMLSIAAKKDSSASKPSSKSSKSDILEFKKYVYAGLESVGHAGGGDEEDGGDGDVDNWRNQRRERMDLHRASGPSPYSQPNNVT